MTKNKGFTILELMISMTLFAIIITSVILAVEHLSIARIKTLNRIALMEELYFFSEQLFMKIKDGGTIDYEEYWDRQSVGTQTESGHYMKPTGVGNYGIGGTLLSNSYGIGIYLCKSNNGVSMGTGGCLTGNNNGGNGTASGTPLNFNGSYQRYGEYITQFTDYNGNVNNDGGDEDKDGSIIGDDDDRAIGVAPTVLTGSITELYLINKTAKERIYFRWNITQDPNNTSITCNYAAPTNSGCIGNVQVLKLSGLDVGFTHSGTNTSDKTAYDGVIDTWVCTEDSQCSGPIVSGSKRLATGTGSEWSNLFPSTINVKNLSFQAYPVQDPWISWAAQDCTVESCTSPFIHPYVRMNLEMGFSWGKRRTIKNEDPTISISTSISLADFQ